MPLRDECAGGQASSAGPKDAARAGYVPSITAAAHLRITIRVENQVIFLRSWSSSEGRMSNGSSAATITEDCGITCEQGVAPAYILDGEFADPMSRRNWIARRAC